MSEIAGWRGPASMPRPAVPLFDTRSAWFRQLVPRQATFASYSFQSAFPIITATLREKCSGRSLGTESVQRRVLPVLGDDRSFSFRLLTTIAPVDPDRPPFIPQPLDHRVVATFRHHGADRPSNSPHERPSGANPPRRIEDDNSVGSLHAKIERFVIVAVGDPPLARKQSALLHPPLVIRRPDPAWLPIVEVEMDQR